MCRTGAMPRREAGLRRAHSLGLTSGWLLAKLRPKRERGSPILDQAAVLVPLAGAFLWKYAGFRSAFLGGAAIAVAGVLVASKLPPCRSEPV